MTPKQKYDERKRLRAERLLREEQSHAGKYYRDRAHQDEGERIFTALLDAIERIADALELWADMQAAPQSAPQAEGGE